VAKRRSFEDGLTADEEAFVKQGRVTPTARKPKPKPPSKPKPKIEEPKMSTSALKQHVIEESPQTSITLAVAPTSAMTSNLSVRIDPRIAAATLRAMTERKIEGISPATQQDIVAEAMVDWLKKHGYFR
jgi:hypothetical protein